MTPTEFKALPDVASVLKDELEQAIRECAAIAQTADADILYCDDHNLRTAIANAILAF